MSLGLLFVIFVAVIIIFCIAASRLAPMFDRRGDAQVEQEIHGVGADQKEEAPEDRGAGLMG